MTKAKRPRGRPTLYTPELAQRICERMAAGESLNAICKPDGMPAESTVRLWHLDNVEGFSAKYTRAIELRAMKWGEEVLELADTQKPGTRVEEGPEGTKTVTEDMLGHRRLQVDTRKWLLSKVLPKVYGEKVEHEHSGKVTLESLVLASVEAKK